MNLRRTISPLAVIFITLLLLTPEKVTSTTSEEEINIQVYRTRNPGVVNITTTVVSYDFLFNPIPEQGTGSGSIIDKKGHILTNFHVIEGGQFLEVTLHDGSKWNAKAVGTDPSNDIAVIKIDAPADKLTVIPLGDSNSLEVGQRVLAIGNPFGLQGTLTTGIISSLGRTMRARNGRLMEDIIQTDASINPGNSGGPLLNTKGEMIGINTAIFSPVGASVGIGFAIPINTVKKAIPHLISKGYVSRPWLGIVGQEITPEFANLLRLKAPGILIAEIVTKSPAHKAGLKSGRERVRVGNFIITMGGDLITSVDANKVNTMDELVSYVESKNIGDTVRINIFRGNKPMIVNVRLEERPRE